MASAVGLTGQGIRIKQMDTYTTGVALVGMSGQTLDGGSTLILNGQYQSVTLESDNANWDIVAFVG